MSSTVRRSRLCGEPRRASSKCSRKGLIIAKLTFPTLIASVYSKAISELRSDLILLAEKARKSPGIIPDFVASLSVLTANLGVSLPEAGVPGQPTSASAVLNGAGGVIFLFSKGANTTSLEYRKSTDGAVGATFGAWTALPSNRALTGQAAGAAVFQLRGVNASGQGVASANTASVTIT